MPFFRCFSLLTAVNGGGGRSAWRKLLSFPRFSFFAPTLSSSSSLSLSAPDIILVVHGVVAGADATAAAADVTMTGEATELVGDFAVSDAIDVRMLGGRCSFRDIMRLERCTDDGESPSPPPLCTGVRFAGSGEASSRAVPVLRPSSFLPPASPPPSPSSPAKRRRALL